MAKKGLNQARLLEPRGCRGFITNAARKIGTVGGSLRDGQLLRTCSVLDYPAYIEAV